MSGENYAAVVDLAESRGITAYDLALTGGSSLSFNEAGGRAFEIPLTDLRAAHEGFFPKLMGAEAALA